SGLSDARNTLIECEQVGVAAPVAQESRSDPSQCVTLLDDVRAFSIRLLNHGAWKGHVENPVRTDQTSSIEGSTVGHPLAYVCIDQPIEFFAIAIVAFRN